VVIIRQTKLTEPNYKKTTIPNTKPAHDYKKHVVQLIKQAHGY
jgi:hypothetical protein